ncbi:MAG: hypothetical protein M1827_003880 [Pycnora praestabilis]|nr:MAG: hypothetical protein M1827_003880 [Pycnora praestabilis]
MSIRRALYPYLPEMIESFGVPKNKVAKWAGITSATFSLSQCLTGIAWGRASDKFGRKLVILAGLTFTMITSIAFGFSNSLAWAIVARVLAGLGNGNVGIIRTTVAEIVPQKELQPRAFSVMPLVWTIGSIFGPSFGGFLANPAQRHPALFGGNDFFKKFPFALPNLVAGVFFMVGIITGLLFLKVSVEDSKVGKEVNAKSFESLASLKHRPDFGIAIGNKLTSLFRRESKRPQWKEDDEQSSSLLRHHRISFTSVRTEEEPPASLTICRNPHQKPVVSQPPPGYREVFSQQSNINLLVYSILAMHSQAFDQLLPIFMHHPPQNHINNPSVHLPFKFSGGFGLDSQQIGFLFTLYGIFGMFVQFLLFPPLARHFGILNCLKVCSLLFPIVYVMTPFTALLATSSSRQVVMVAIMLVKCVAVIFAFPCSTILLTNSAVSLRILGTLNGVATSVSAIGRAAGPALGGGTFSAGVDSGYMILSWWILASIAAIGIIPVWWLVEMEGFGGETPDSEDEDDYLDDVYPPNVDDAPERTRIFTECEDLQEEDDDDDFAVEDGSPLMKTTSNRRASLSDFPRRFSSPLGMKEGLRTGWREEIEQ